MGGFEQDLTAGLLEYLLTLLQPNVMYEYGYDAARWMLAVLSPILFIFCFHARVISTQLNPKQGDVFQSFKDIFILGLFLLLYFGIITIALELLNKVHETVLEYGSVKYIMEMMAKFLESVDVKQDESSGLVDQIVNFSNAPLRMVTFTIFLITFVLLIVVQILESLAHAILFCVCICWGPIAIPTTMAGQKFSLLKGWGILAMWLSVWPLISAVILYVVTPYLSQPIAAFENPAQASINSSVAGVYFVMAVLNLLAAVLIGLGPFVASGLVNNTGGVMGVLGTFAGAAAATTFGAAAMGAAGMKAFGGQAASAMGLNKAFDGLKSFNQGAVGGAASIMGGVFSQAMNTMKNLVSGEDAAGGGGSNNINSDSKPKGNPVTGNNSNMSSNNSGGSVTGNNTSSDKSQKPRISNHDNKNTDSKSRKLDSKEQAKRGAIINKQHKKRLGG